MMFWSELAPRAAHTPAVVSAVVSARVLRVLAPCLCLCLLAGGCIRDGEERALSDRNIGLASVPGAVDITVADGLAHIREVSAPGADASTGDSPGRIRLWAGAPKFELTLELDPARVQAGETWDITVENCMPDAVMTNLAADAEAGAIDIVAYDGPRATVCGFLLTPQAGASPTVRLAVAPADADTTEGTWRFAVMGDVQRAMPEVDDVFARINVDPTIRFVVATGDLTQSGATDEYEQWERQLMVLNMPLFSTIGNHELSGPHQRWSRRFGRFNSHFRFRGTAFSLVDSGSASIDPLVYDWLDDWLDSARDDIHFFFTHIPPIDPIGVRAGSFRSANEAHKLLARLARGQVDITFYGHIHSYYAYQNAGMPAYISGGGGALPERWDGIGRHYLTVDVVGQRVENVAVVRVD